MRFPVPGALLWLALTYAAAGSCSPSTQPAAQQPELQPAAAPQAATGIAAPTAPGSPTGEVSRSGANISNADYDLAMSASPSNAVAINVKATLNVQITPKKDWILKLDTPYDLTLSATPGGVAFDKTLLSAKDFVDPTAHAKTAACGFVATTPGDKTLNADLEFYLCNPEICTKFKANPRLSLAVN